MTGFYILWLSVTGVLYILTPTEMADLGGFYIKESTFCSPDKISLTCAASDEILMILGVTFARSDRRCKRDKCDGNLVSVNATLYKSVVDQCSGRSDCDIDNKLVQSMSCDDGGPATKFKTSHICVPKQSVIPICTNQTLTVNKGMVWSNNYLRMTSAWPQSSSANVKPLSLSMQPEYKCQCQMKVENDNIRLQIVEMDLTGSCSHKLAIQSTDNMDNNQHRHEYDCRAKYQTKADVVKKATSLVITLKSTWSGREGRGRFALVFRKVSSVAVSSNPKVQVVCRHYSPQPPPQITPTPEVTQQTVETQTSSIPPSPSSSPSSPPPSSSPSSPPSSSPPTPPPSSSSPPPSSSSSSPSSSLSSSPLPSSPSPSPPPLPSSPSPSPSSTISKRPTSPQPQGITQSTPITTSAVPTRGDKTQSQQQNDQVVIGGSIGGAVAGLILICVGIFIVLRWRKSSKENKSSFDNISPSYNNRGYEAETDDHMYQDPQLTHDYQDPTVGSDTATANYETAAHNNKKDNVYDKLNDGTAFDNAIYCEEETGKTENIYDSLEERHALYSSQPTNQMVQDPTYHELDTAEYESGAVSNNDPCYFELESDRQPAEPSAPSMDTINRTDQETTYLDLENI